MTSFLFHANLSFFLGMDQKYAKNKSEMALRLIRIQCRINFNPAIAKLLYTSLVRADLEFANLGFEFVCGLPIKVI